MAPCCFPSGIFLESRVFLVLGAEQVLGGSGERGHPDVQTHTEGSLGLLHIPVWCPSPGVAGGCVRARVRASGGDVWYRPVPHRKVSWAVPWDVPGLSLDPGDTGCTTPWQQEVEMSCPLVPRLSLWAASTPPGPLGSPSRLRDPPHVRAGSPARSRPCWRAAPVSPRPHVPLGAQSGPLTAPLSGPLGRHTGLSFQRHLHVPCVLHTV